MLYGRIHVVPYKIYMKFKDDVTGFTHVFLPSSLKPIVQLNIKNESFIIQCKEEKGKWAFTETPSFTPQWIDTKEELKKLCVKNMKRHTTFTLENQDFVKPYRLTAFRKDIHQKCGVELRLDYGYKLELTPLNEIHLGLFYQNKVVSYIELYHWTDNHSIVIASHTTKVYEGRKYNILLRAISILLGKYMYDSEKLISNASNPISVWIMTQHFDAEMDDDFKKYTKKHPFSFEHTKKYLKNTKQYIELTVPLEKKYLDKATRVYEHILSELKCP